MTVNKCKQRIRICQNTLGEHGLAASNGQEDTGKVVVVLGAHKNWGVVRYDESVSKNRTHRALRGRGQRRGRSQDKR